MDGWESEGKCRTVGSFVDVDVDGMEERDGRRATLDDTNELTVA